VNVDTLVFHEGGGTGKKRTPGGRYEKECLGLFLANTCCRGSFGDLLDLVSAISEHNTPTRGRLTHVQPS
jgi:hypothetical protein